MERRFRHFDVGDADGHGKQHHLRRQFQRRIGAGGERDGPSRDRTDMSGAARSAIRRCLDRAALVEADIEGMGVRGRHGDRRRVDDGDDAESGAVGGRRREDDRLACDGSRPRGLPGDAEPAGGSGTAGLAAGGVSAQTTSTRQSWQGLVRQQLLDDRRNWGIMPETRGLTRSRCRVDVCGTDLSVKAEYLYYDLGAAQFTNSALASGFRRSIRSLRLRGRASTGSLPASA